VSRYDGEPRVFVYESKRTRGLEAKAVNITCLGRQIRSPRAHVPLPASTDSYLPVVPSITGSETEYLYWGDTHLHTSLLFDAGGFGNRLDPRAAFRFARGEEVISSTPVAATHTWATCMAFNLETR